MKKILYINPQSGDNLAMYDYELLSRIHGFDIMYAHNQTYNYKELNNVKHEAIFSYSQMSNSLSKGISYCKSLFKLYRIIKSRKPNIVHIQWFRLPIIEYLLYKYLKKTQGIILIHTVHNILPHVCKKSDFKNYSRLYSLCDGLIVHTKKASVDLYSKFSLENIIITAPHGPLRYTFSKDDINEEIIKIKKLYNVKAKYVITLLGYQSLYKGTDMAIKAWRNSKFLSNNKELCFIVAGHNRDYKATIENTDYNLVIINSKLSDLTFASFLRMSDLVLLPYRNIEQSGVLLSIVEEEIPYCTTNVGELTKPFEYGDVGWTIETPSVDAIQSKLENIFMNPNEIERKKNNKNSWKKIKKYYSWDTAAEKTIELYLKLT